MPDLIIYGSFDQVYASWEITDFACKKMLEYCPDKILIREE